MASYVNVERALLDEKLAAHVGPVRPWALESCLSGVGCLLHGISGGRIKVASQNQ